MQVNAYICDNCGKIETWGGLWRRLELTSKAAGGYEFAIHACSDCCQTELNKTLVGMSNKKAERFIEKRRKGFMEVKS